ncbi:hypothetical protein BE21_16975 [Sorangium cellulosum]|uniref:Uncharacterized protein n=1 Tax=Sorangium cellulosum TaxID=56 RepID=A0A150TY28_SORCE|nr:hypothetical protein BE21_16975 [Sorangium cellulosum]
MLVATLGACGSVEVDRDPGGAGASGGAGGSEPFPETCSPPERSAVCDTDVKRCGNGVQDTCEVCWSVDGSPVQCSDVTEACDGAVSETCGSLGYAGGGRLACSDVCSIDVRDCDSCLGAPSQVACARPRVDGYNVGGVALASDGEGLAAAWLSFDDQLHFARFSMDLALESQWSCVDIPSPGSTVALAPSPGGFILALGGAGDGPVLRLYRLDPAGNEIATRTIADAMYPVLAARPGAAPLLVYTSGEHAAAQGALVAELLDEEANAAWQATVADAVYGDLTAAAFADPGFLVAARAIAADGSSTTELVPIDASGAVGPARELPGIDDVALAPAGADRAAGVWSDGERFEVGWFDGQAAAVGAPVTIAARDAAKATQEHAIAVSNGRAVVALVEEGDRQLSLFHVDADGSVAVPRYGFAREPLGLSRLAAAPAGEGAALVWTTYAEPGSSRFVLGRAQR